MGILNLKCQLVQFVMTYSKKQLSLNLVCSGRKKGQTLLPEKEVPSTYQKEEKDTDPHMVKVHQEHPKKQCGQGECSIDL